MDATHQTSPLTVQVGVNFLFESRFVEVAGPDGDAQRDGFFLRFAGYVLVDGDGGVDAAAFFEERADCAAGAFGRDEDDVHVGGDVHFGEVFEDGGEAVGEVEGLYLLDLRGGGEWDEGEVYLFAVQLWFNRRPCLALSCVAQKIHNDSAF